MDPDTDLLSHLDSTLEKAEYLFPEACEDEDLGLELLETLEDIAILNDGLYELTPFLESIPIEYEENDSLESLRLITAEGGEAKILYVNIIDKFPEAETFSPGLVNQLADLNLARKNRLWEAKKLHEAIPVSAGGGGGTGKGLGGYSPKSSLYTASSRYTTGSSVDSIPYSLMDLKEEYEYARSEASASSFNSADLDIVGRTRIPPPPIRLDGQEVSFECNLCFETLHSVSSKYQWK